MGALSPPWHASSHRAQRRRRRRPQSPAPPWTAGLPADAPDPASGLRPSGSGHAGSCSFQRLRAPPGEDGRPGWLWQRHFRRELVPATLARASLHISATPPRLGPEPLPSPGPEAQAGAGLCAERPMGTKPGGRGVAAPAPRLQWRLFQDGGRGGPLPAGLRVLEPRLYPLPRC